MAHLPTACIAAVAALTLVAAAARATDADQNGIADERELPLARRFAPTLALHGPDTELNGIHVPVYPVPVEIMGLRDAEPGAGLPADRLFVVWSQQPLDYPYGDHWVKAQGWSPPLAEASPAHDYSALTDDPALRSLAPPAMPFGPYTLRFHWEYGNPAVDTPAEWYAVWEAGNAWSRPGFDFPPTAYAHLRRAADAGFGGPPGAVLVQYWFFFPFNDWINNHEGDWEGMNVLASSDDPESATVLDVEYFAHQVHIVRPPGMPLGDHCVLVEETHPTAFVGGHGRLTGCIGGTGEGEASHAFYPTPGRFAEVSEGDPLGCFERADEEVALAAGPTVHWSDLAIEVIPAPATIDTRAHPERAWLVADLRFGTRRVPSVGGGLWHDVGNYAPHGPAHNPEDRFGRAAALTRTRPYSSPGDPHARPYLAAEPGWTPFALFLDTFTGMTAGAPGSLAAWTLGTGSWSLGDSGFIGRGDGALRATNRAYITCAWPPDWYTLPFAAWNGRAARFAADLTLRAPLAAASTAGLVVAGAATAGEGNGQVRILLARSGAGHALEVRVRRTAADSLVARAAIADPGAVTHRLEVLTLAADAGGLFHDVWFDGTLVLASVATPGAGDEARGLVADGTAEVRFDRVAFSGLRLEPRYRHPPFAAITAPGPGADIHACPQLVTWQAADEKSDQGIAAQRLRYSTDGGASWVEIAALGGTERSVSWLPPPVTSDRACLLALTVTDVEGDARTVEGGPCWLRAGPPATTVLAPTGGESWMRGTTAIVRFLAPCRELVDLALSTDGGASFPTAVAAGIPNTGEFAWAIPGWLPAGRPCRIRVTGGGFPAGASPADFTLAWDGVLAGGDFEVATPWRLEADEEVRRGDASAAHGIGDPPLGAPLAGRASLFAHARAGGLAPGPGPAPAPDPDPPWPAHAGVLVVAVSELLPLADPGAVRALHVALRGTVIAGAAPGRPARAAARATLTASYQAASGHEVLAEDLLTFDVTRTETGAAEEQCAEIVPISVPPPGATSIRFRLSIAASARAAGPGATAEVEIVADDLRLETAIGVSSDSVRGAAPIMSVHSRGDDTAVIELALPASAPVSLAAFAPTGRLVARLLDRRPLPRGRHALTWNTRGLPRGAYFLRLTAGGRTAVAKWLVAP